MSRGQHFSPQFEPGLGILRLCWEHLALHENLMQKKGHCCILWIFTAEEFNSISVGS